MRGAAPGVLGDVVDLTPRRGNVTSGDQALLVAGDDRPPLMHGEDPIRGRDPDDPPLVHEDALNRPRARDLRRHRDGDVGTGTGDRRPPTIATRSERGASEAGIPEGSTPDSSAREGSAGGLSGMVGEVCRVDRHDDDR
jgi:hypothetical protein